MFVPGMPVVVNQNAHQGLKLVNGASYTALEVIVDKTDRTILHFGPAAGILLAGETTRHLHFVWHAARHHPLDAHKHQDRVQKEAAMATK
jgi:hypothetical protein